MDEEKIPMRIARAKLRMSQKDLAKILGVSRQLVWSWESGKIIPKFDQAQRICEILMVPINRIFFG